jgi:hypothetical protein
MLCCPSCSRGSQKNFLAGLLGTNGNGPFVTSPDTLSGDLAMQRMFTFVHNGIGNHACVHHYATGENLAYPLQERVFQILRNHFHGSKSLSINPQPQNVIAAELFLDRLDASRTERMARPLSRVHHR